MFKIVHAGFLGKNHVVYDSGQIHDLNVVPETVEIEADGFILEDGSFITREEATQALHADHKVQSEELIKAQPAPDMPGLGVERRPQTPAVDAKQAETKQKLMINAGKNVGVKLKSPTKSRAGTAVVGLSGAAGTGTAISYALQRPGARGTQHHEDLHQMFNRVQDKYGHEARVNLASNLFSAIPEDNRHAVREYVHHLYGQQEPPSNRWHEEHLAHLITYLNSFPQRMMFHNKQGTWDPNINGLTESGKAFNVKMKQAHRHFQEAASKADERWLKQFIHKSEIDLMHKALHWQPSEQELEIALDLLHTFHDELPEFKAAKFMSNGFQPSQEQIQEALREHEGDYEAAALTAYQLEINDENVRTLRKMSYIYAHQQELSKNEENVAIIPRIVKPFNDQALPVADVIRRAFELDEVHEIKLKGKHTHGTALVRDHETGDLWLLKPGSGNLSPALGISEEKAPQAVRECAFNDCARIMGLGEYVPKSALITLDDQKVSALQFFAADYEPTEKLKKKNIEDLRQIFQMMLLNGLLYKIASLDYVLGQVDRHAGNMLVNPGWDVKLIDAGSTFAGRSFSPSQDSKSTFVPFYLRVFSDRKFSVLTPLEKYNIIPKLGEDSDKALGFWLKNLPEGQLVAKMNEYGINSQPVIDRLNAIRSFNGPKFEFLRRFFSGYEP
jgi:hypothetical protein